MTDKVLKFVVAPPTQLALLLRSWRKKVKRAVVVRATLPIFFVVSFAARLDVWSWNFVPPLPPPPIPKAKSGPVRPLYVPPIVQGKITQHVNKTLAGVYRHIHPETHLASSFTGDGRLEHWSVAFDNAIRAIVHIQTGRPDLSQRILDYFIDNTAIHKTGWFKRRDQTWAKREGWIVNIVDASETRPGGRGVEHIAHTGPNAYLGMAAIHLYRVTAKEKYLNFARKQWGLLKDIQNTDPRDPNYGGIRMGPLGNPRFPEEQRLGFDPKNPSFYHFYNGEHAADFKAFSEMMAVVDPQQKDRYDRASELITKWDKRIYDAKNKLFFIGTTEKKYFDANIGQWVKPGIIPMHPLDTTALKISIYGVKGLETFEKNGAERIRQAVDDHFKVRVRANFPNGESRWITGYDFLSHRDRARIVRYVEGGPRHDKKINMGRGRKPILTDEWSSWVAFADLRLYEDFYKRKKFRKANYYLRSYRNNAIGEAMKSAFVNESGEVVYPYAHPLPYALNKPVGFGWNTQHQPYALIGSLARILGFLRFDPLRLKGGPMGTSIHANVPLVQLGQKRQSFPNPIRLYTEPEMYVRDAWNHTKRAKAIPSKAADEWKKAIQVVDRMNAEHPDWILTAKKQNQQASRSLEPYPLMGTGNVTIKELEPVYRRYWALYHMGSAEFVRLMAYAHLRDWAEQEGNLTARDRYHQNALKSASRIRQDFEFSQTYDERGWLWQPAHAIHEYIH